MKFSEFLDVRDGTHDSPKRVNIGKKLITTKNLEDNRIDFTNAKNISLNDFKRINERSKVDQFDILLSMIGTVGNVYQERSAFPDYAIKNLALLKFHGDELLSNWMNYYLQSKKGQSKIHQRLSGSTQQYISLTDLRNIEITLPNRDQMELCIKPLRYLDDLILKNNQINDNLVELINLIYLKFCADFPAKEKVSLDDVFNTSTKTFNVNENKNINIWHFSIPNFDCNKQPQCESTNSIKSNKKKVNSFGVLVSKLNPNFKRIWAPNLDFYSNYSPIASPEFIQINGNSQEEQALIFCILNSEEYTDFLVSNATGSTNSRQRVKPKIAVSYIIPFDLDKKKGLESLVSPILKDIQQREFENTKLQIIKDTLLNKYF
ncbi:restriction endonuclease subunit S [Limosilactobacillus reuteri]|uniref:restriction endonuclease subunit S n=1 Tax=Limosilactobacillus reuteri TaxID=1598 RepID=UPI003993D76E